MRLSSSVAESVWVWLHEASLHFECQAQFGYVPGTGQRSAGALFDSPQPVAHRVGPIGTMTAGLEGFRQSHREAEAARRVALVGAS